MAPTLEQYAACLMVLYEYGPLGDEAAQVEYCVCLKFTWANICESKTPPIGERNVDAFTFVTLATLAAGAGGTGLGGFIGALFRTESNRTVSLLLSLAGGVMLSIVCFDLLIEAMDAGQGAWGQIGGLVLVGAALLAGVGVVAALNYAIDRRTSKEVPHVAAPEHPRTHDNLDELIHSDHLAQHRLEHASRASLFVAGIVMACAIALHNVPEGMTIGASYAAESDLIAGSALVLAVLIGLHNIPEGMAVSVPLISGGMPRVKAVLITMASGVPTVLGAWLGLWLGDIGPVGLAISLGLASGAMLYVVFGEIFPQAVLMYRSKLPAFFVVAGMMLGMLIIYL